MRLSTNEFWNDMLTVAAHDRDLLDWISARPGGRGTPPRGVYAAELVSGIITKIGDAPEIREVNDGYLLGKGVLQAYAEEFRLLGAEMERALEEGDFRVMRSEWLDRAEKLQEQYTRIANMDDPNGLPSFNQLVKPASQGARLPPRTPIKHLGDLLFESNTVTQAMRKAFDAWKKAYKETISDAIYNFEKRGTDLIFISKPEQFDVSGVRVVVAAHDRPQSQIRAAVDKIRMAVDMIRRAGVGVSLRDLVIKISPKESDSRACAFYVLSSKEIHLTPSFFGQNCGGLGTIIHEIGHRFYYVLVNDGALKGWETEIAQRQHTLTQEDINRAGHLVQAWLAHTAKHPEYETLSRMDRLLAADAYAVEYPADGPKHRAIQRAILRQIAWNSYGRKASQVSDLANILSLVGQASYMMEPTDKGRPTDYGATKPEEAFAEVFKLYVMDGPRAVGPWTRALFREIARSGANAPLRNPKPRRRP